jgi:hypothetical protein
LTFFVVSSVCFVLPILFAAKSKHVARLNISIITVFDVFQKRIVTRLLNVHQQKDRLLDLHGKETQLSSPFLKEEDTKPRDPFMQHLDSCLNPRIALLKESLR